MKRLIIATVLLLGALAAGTRATAQVLDGPRFGIMAGVTSSSTDLSSLDTKSISQYHVGLTTELPLGLGFAIQPSLLYQVKGLVLSDVGSTTVSDIVDSFEAKVGYLELPVQIQWGPDLVAFRPYAFAEPFAGYRLTTKTDGASEETFTDGLKKVEYGLGVGVGLEFWKIQVSGKYFWNFGSMYGTDIDATGNTIKSALKDGNNFNGIAFSVALLF